MQKAKSIVQNNALASSQETGKLPKTTPERLETIKYMGLSFRIWPDLFLVSWREMEAYNLAIGDEKDPVPCIYESRTYAIMEGARIIFQRRLAEV
jgi:hypothetical protein